MFEEESSPKKADASLNQATDFQKVIACNKITNVLIQESEKITIINYIKKEGSLFEKAYVVY